MRRILFFTNFHLFVILHTYKDRVIKDNVRILTTNLGHPSPLFLYAQNLPSPTSPLQTCLSPPPYFSPHPSFGEFKVNKSASV